MCELGETFCHVLDAAGAEGKGDVGSDIFDALMEGGIFAGAGAEEFGAIVAASTFAQLSAASEAFLAATGVVIDGPIHAGDIFEIREFEINVAALFGESCGGGGSREREGRRV